MQELDTQMLPDGRHDSETEIGEPTRITTSEAARELGVSTSTIRRWVSRGYLDATRTPTGYLVDASGLAAAQELASAKRKPAVPRTETASTADDLQDDRVVSEQPSAVRMPIIVSQLVQPSSEPREVAPPEPHSPDPVAAQVQEPQVPESRASAFRPTFQSDPSRMLEGLQRGIILEQAKYLRAERRKDSVAIERSAWRLAELYERLDDAQATARVAHRDADTSRPSLSALRALRAQAISAAFVSSATYAKAAPSRRVFSVATFLILNGMLMMLMSVIS